MQRYPWTWKENAISGKILVGWKRSPRHEDANNANLRDGTGTLDVERERSLWKARFGGGEALDVDRNAKYGKAALDVERKPWT